MNFIKIVGLVFIVVGVFSSIGVYTAIKSSNMTMKKVTIGLLSVSVIIATSTLFLGTKSVMAVEGVSEEYVTDDYGKVTMSADISDVDSYDELSVKVKEKDGKEVADDDVLITIEPSKDKVNISYTYKRGDKKSEYLAVVIQNGDSIFSKNVLIKPHKNYIDEKKQNEELKKMQAELEDKLKEDENSNDDRESKYKTIRLGDNSFLESDFNEFNDAKKKWVSKVNKEVADDYNLVQFVKSIDIDKDSGKAIVVVSDLMLDRAKSDKEELTELLGKRTVGFIRGTLAIASSSNEILVQIKTENKTIVGESLSEQKPELISMK